MNKNGTAGHGESWDAQDDGRSREEIEADVRALAGDQWDAPLPDCVRSEIGLPSNNLQHFSNPPTAPVGEGGAIWQQLSRVPRVRST